MFSRSARMVIPVALSACLLLPASSNADTPEARRLSEAIRLKTISPGVTIKRDTKPFLAFHQLVKRRFPRTHRTLKQETVNRLSLLYTWRGSDPSLDPLLLTAHFDVVPVPPDSRERWTHDPFGGEQIDGFVWGRGALDDKVGVMGMLEATERLAKAGFKPKRTVLLAFGHDEEQGGVEGAGETGKLLEKRGLRPWMSLDEGMAIISGGFGGIDKPLALIGIAEKGYMTARITAHARGGHSSVPPPDSAIGKLATAVTALERNQMPARLDGVIGDMLDALSVHQSPMRGWMARNRWLTGPLLRRMLVGSPTTAAFTRTTTAVTMINAGVKANVLPSQAMVTVNFRILPGDTSEDVEAHIRKVVGSELDVEIERSSEPSPISPVDSDAFALLSSVLQQRYPGVGVAPALVTGGTDTRHYVGITQNAYRFTPMQLGSDDIPRVHGIDERLSIEDYGQVIGTYEALIRAAAGDRGGL